MRRILLGAMVALSMTVVTPAYADHGGYDEGCGRNGGCGNEREESYGNDSCKYVCPAFDKSPVQDSFNIQICVQPGSCSTPPEGEGNGGQQPPG